MANQLFILNWWDIENCLLPSDSDPRDIGRAIKAFMESKGFLGPMVLNAVAAAKDTIPEATQQIFNEITSGVNFYHLINQRAKDACDHEIERQINSWVKSNPPPAVIMIISGDHGYAKLVQRLNSLGYTTVVVCRDSADSAAAALKAVAQHVFHWEDVTKGCLKKN